jgi:hypothetical protein
MVTRPVHLDRASWRQVGVEEKVLHLRVDRKQRDNKRGAWDNIQTPVTYFL